MAKEFTPKQQAQVEAVENAAANLISVLTGLPVHLIDDQVKIAELVADRLSDDFICYYPTRLVTPDGEEHIENMWTKGQVMI